MRVAASPHSFLIPLFSLLPLEGGAPKGRRLALEAVFSLARMPTPPRFARLPLPEEGARMILNRASLFIKIDAERRSGAFVSSTLETLFPHSLSSR